MRLGGAAPDVLPEIGPPNLEQSIGMPTSGPGLGLLPRTLFKGLELFNERIGEPFGAGVAVTLPDLFKGELTRGDEAIERYRELPIYAQMAAELPLGGPVANVPLAGAKTAVRAGARQIGRNIPRNIPTITPPRPAPGAGSLTPSSVPGAIISKDPVLTDLPGLQHTMDINFQDNWMRTLGQKLDKMPQVMEQINPSAAAIAPEERMMIGRMILMDAAESRATAAVAYLEELGRPFRVDRLGRVTNVAISEGTSPYIGDVLTAPQGYPLNATQAEYARRAHSLLQQNLTSLKSRGVEVAEQLDFSDAIRQINVSVEMGAGRYFPRIPIGTVQRGGKGRMRIGKKITQQQERIWESQKQGVEEGGVAYMTDPTEVMRLTLEAAGKAEADQLLANNIRSVPGIKIGSEVGRGEAMVSHPAFRNVVMPQEMADNINRVIGDKPLEVIGRISNVQDVIRALGTGLDPGFLLIQGVITAPYRPVAWGKAAGVSMASVINPKFASLYLTRPENQAVIQRMVSTSSVPFGSSEFLIASQRGLGKVPVAGAAFRRAGTAFNTYLDVARIELHKSLSHIAKSDSELRELTNVIDQIVGLSSSRALGVTANRRALEGAFGLFAPRYQRAGTALMGSLAQGGVRGRIARRAVGQFLFGSAALMTGVAMATGQWDLLDPRQGKNGVPKLFDPRTGGFLSVRMGDSQVGVGGVTVSILRRFGNVGEEITEGDLLGTLGAGLQSYRGLAAPLTSDVIDVTIGRRFMGEETRSPIGALQVLAQDVLPFPAQPFAEAAIQRELQGRDVNYPGPESPIASFLGLRERGLTAGELRRDARDDDAKNSGLMRLDGQPVREWKDLNRAQQRDAEKNNPDLQRLSAQADELRYYQSSAEKRRILDDQESNRQQRVDRITALARSLWNGAPNMTRQKYDDQRGRIMTEYSAKRELLWKQQSRLENAGSLEQWKAENQRPEDQALDAYYEKRDKFLKQRPFMTSQDWQMLEVTMYQWLENTYGPQIRTYDLQQRDTWLEDMPPVVQLVEELRRQMIEGAGRPWFSGYRNQVRPLGQRQQVGAAR